MLFSSLLAVIAIAVHCKARSGKLFLNDGSIVLCFCNPSASHSLALFLFVGALFAILFLLCG
jgi:hypothetical protein